VRPPSDAGVRVHPDQQGVVELAGECVGRDNEADAGSNRDDFARRIHVSCALGPVGHRRADAVELREQARLKEDHDARGTLA